MKTNQAKSRGGGSTGWLAWGRRMELPCGSKGPPRRRSADTGVAVRAAGARRDQSRTGRRFANLNQQRRPGSGKQDETWSRQGCWGGGAGAGGAGGAGDGLRRPQHRAGTGVRAARAMASALRDFRQSRPLGGQGWARRRAGSGPSWNVLQPHTSVTQPQRPLLDAGPRLHPRHRARANR